MSHLTLVPEQVAMMGNGMTISPIVLLRLIMLTGLLKKEVELMLV